MLYDGREDSELTLIIPWVHIYVMYSVFPQEFRFIKLHCSSGSSPIVSLDGLGDA